MLLLASTSYADEHAVQTPVTSRSVKTVPLAPLNSGSSVTVQRPPARSSDERDTAPETTLSGGKLTKRPCSGTWI